MAGVRKLLIEALNHGVAIAVGVSAAFLALAAATSPGAAAAAAVPASVAIGLVRARFLPHPTPHCESAPSFRPVAVVNAPKVATLVGTSGGATSAA